MKRKQNPTPRILSQMDYGNLMQKRIRKILLICSTYDAFILEEDGRIDGQINREYMDLGLSNPPTFTRVSSSKEALRMLRDDREVDLVISMLNVGELDVFHFAKQLKCQRADIPVVLLTNLTKDINRRIQQEDLSGIDYVFSWRGSADLILAIVKLIEDRMNADRDILEVGVQSILLVEDSIRFYSSYLPAIYKLVLQQGAEFLKETLNEQQQMLRKRARPKILMATNYEEAVQLYERYKTNLLGVISDVGFVLKKNDPMESEKLDAGIELCRMIKGDDPHMPFLLQSSQDSIRDVARALGVGFLAKRSKTLLIELADYIAEEFAFGDFVFRNPVTGQEIGRARDLKQLQKWVMEIPEEVLAYYTARNRLSKWMYARGLFFLAGVMRTVQSAQFDSMDGLREFVVEAVNDYRILQGQGVVAEFDPETYDSCIWFARIGEGSLGGKARGLAFMNSILQRHELATKYEKVRVILPRTVVVATDYFDQYIRENDLQEVINSEGSDEEIFEAFQEATLPEELIAHLRVYLQTVNVPLAVRSSSKLEDSYQQPFAGIYSTYMIPHRDDPKEMLRLLESAIKGVYASVFFAGSRAYILSSANLLSDEKMAVMLQEVCGTEDNGYFFPTISGVARSLNFYPIGNEKSEEGVANIAVGLGKTVVDGGQSLRFSPHHPKQALQLSTPDLAMGEAQRELFALRINGDESSVTMDDGANLACISVQDALEFRNLRHVTSTWEMQNQRLSDAPFAEGMKVVTFAKILKYDAIPLAQILSDLLQIGENEMAIPVEVEFAVNMDLPLGEESLFSFLQIRPIVNAQESKPLDWEQVDLSDALIDARQALGVGAIHGVRDVVYVRSEGFDPAATREIATEIGELNSRFRSQEAGYLLAGPGRWGSADTWLGIPVAWHQISEARVIVEYGMERFQVEPSQGTHFFQNMTSFGVGYMTVNPHRGDGTISMEQLDRMEAIYESDRVRWVRFPEPLYIYIDGCRNRGLVKAESV